VPGQVIGERGSAKKRCLPVRFRHVRGVCEGKGVSALPASPATVAAFAHEADRGSRAACFTRGCAAIRYANRLADLTLVALRMPPAIDNDRGHGLWGLVMICTMVVRALVLTTALAAALIPVWCFGEDVNPLPAKAIKELPRELLSQIKQKKMPKYSAILMRVFKEEAELEVWKQDATGRFQLLKVFPICRWSGDIGPKEHEGDRRGLRRHTYYI
jgi:hypothetical protein